MNLDLRLLTGEGTLVASSMGLGSSELVQSFVTPGDYVLHAIKQTGWGGGYTLNVHLASDPDCNGNGQRDACEILDGLAVDCNANLVPDECRPGDFDGNETVALNDHLSFTDCLAGPCLTGTCGSANDIGPCCAIMDFDANGVVDLRDGAAFQRAFLNP